MAQLSKKDQIRERAEQDLEAFIKLVAPYRVLGSIHKEIIGWWQRPDAKSHQLLLLPRDHGKSALVAYRVAHALTKDPTLRVLYISSTANLAIKQLKFVKDILTSDIYRRYWPDHVNIDEGKREKWTETEISLDHPMRKAEGIRDPSIFTAGLTTSITGLHCDIAVLDDVVVRENAYKEEGRQKVKEQYSLLSSIETSDAQEWAVGTRYHPRDLYDELVKMEYEEYNDEGEIIDSIPLYEVFERQVENVGDGTGEFLWPRQQRYDGKWFGFNQEILAKKRAQYLDRTQFRAQYYNDPNDPDGVGIDANNFQYYDRQFLRKEGSHWFYKGKRLNIAAAIDFAFSLAKKADYTTIAVVGVDCDRNYFVLDLERFKTDQISEYFTRILKLHNKWDFRKLKAEVTSAQQVIVKDLKENYIKPHGLALVVEDHRPTRHDGAKEERTNAILQPRYANRQMWHYQGGNCQTLEEELVLSNPPHDDVKDCLAVAVDTVIAPSAGMNRLINTFSQTANKLSHSRFGGLG